MCVLSRGCVTDTSCLRHNIPSMMTPQNLPWEWSEQWTKMYRNQSKKRMNNCKMYVCSLVKIVSRCLKRRNTPKIDEIKKMEEKREKTNKQKSVSLSFRSNCACSGDVLLFCTLLFSHMCIFIVEWEILPIRMRKNIYV